MENTYISRDIPFRAADSHVGCMAHQINLGCQAFLKAVKADATVVGQVGLGDLDPDDVEEMQMQMDEDLDGEDEPASKVLLTLTKKVREIHPLSRRFGRTVCIDHARNWNGSPTRFGYSA